MDREQCRFCQVVPNRNCPNLNGLSTQLIQYHYGEEFYFYFAKAVNDILLGSKTPETIVYRSLCSETEKVNLKLKYLTQSKASSTFSNKILPKRHQKFDPLLVNHECWKILQGNKAGFRGQKSTEAGQSRRRRPAGLYPLRQGSLFGKLLPSENKKDHQGACEVHFADVGGSFCTRIFDIYSPSYSSKEVESIPEEKKRKDSIYLENRYEIQPKPKVPLLDIKKLVKNKSAGDILKSSGDFNKGTFSKGNLQASTQNYSTQFSLEASRSRLPIQSLKPEEAIHSRSIKRPKTLSKSKKKSIKGGEEKTQKKSLKKDESKINLNFNVRGSNPLIKNNSIKTKKGWSDFFHSKRSIGETLMSYRQKRTETKPSLIGTEMLSSRTAKDTAAKGFLHGRGSLTRKSMIISNSSPKVKSGLIKNLKYSLKIENHSRPTLQLVKEQLAKLSGKTASSNSKIVHNIATVRSNSKKKIDFPLIAFTTSPVLKLDKKGPMVLSHHLMPSMRLLKSSEDHNLEGDRSPQTHRYTNNRKLSVGASASKSTGRKKHPSAKKKSPEKKNELNIQVFDRKAKKPGKKKPLLISVNN